LAGQGQTGNISHGVVPKGIFGGVSQGGLAHSSQYIINGGKNATSSFRIIWLQRERPFKIQDYRGSQPKLEVEIKTINYSSAYDQNSVGDS
jgi:hypothetical protein